MGEFFFRTEDIAQDEVLDFFVETSRDRETLTALKSRAPVLLKGSRGVGKSFLLRTAQAEMERDFEVDRVLPVYLTFASAPLIKMKATTDGSFLNWMTSKIINRIIRAATQHGVTLPAETAMQTMLGAVGGPSAHSAMEGLERQFETSWHDDQAKTPEVKVPPSDALKDAVEDLCRFAKVKRIVLLVDEAAHVFIPQQQRDFFSLMRDLRSPHLSVKAAIYPGATSFGESFQPTHDAIQINVDRAVTESGYVDSMREMVFTQDDSLKQGILQRGDVFATLAYAATGNPRVLLKLLARKRTFNSTNANEAIKTHFREDIWSEHSNLADRYPGHKALIEWGRTFVEDTVVPDIYKRNLDRTDNTSSYLWVHHDAPQTVKEALRLLCYSGILQEGAAGIRGTRSEVGTRYMVNFGCQIALHSDPVAFGTGIRDGLSIRRMTEYGANNAAYSAISGIDLGNLHSNSNDALDARLKAPVSELDLTSFQKAKLRDLGLDCIGDVLSASEEDFQRAKYVGAVRSRQMRNAAVTAVFEYLSG